jgi:exopolysaccharide biosynthesis polyprenyl glycosylphosphotransferase
MASAGSSTGTLQEPLTEPTTSSLIRNRLHKNQWKYLVASLIVLDCAVVYLALRLSYWIRFHSSLPIFQLEVVPSQETYNLLTLASIPISILIFSLFGLYSRPNLLRGMRETDLILKAATLGIFLVLFADFLTTDFVVARGWLLISWVVTFLLVSLDRFIVRRIVQGLRRRGMFLSPAVIIGTNQEARLLADQLIQQEFSGLQLIGFVDDSLPTGTPISNHLNTVGSTGCLESLVEDNQIEELILAPSAINQADLLSIFQRFGVSPSVNLRMSSGLYEIIATGFQVREFGCVPLVGINKVRMTGSDQAMKTLLDYCLTVPVLLLLVPVFLVMAILIKLDSPGPIFYRRRVMGVNGRQFDAFKFRTMACNGDKILQQHPDLLEEYQKNIKLKNDPRITRIGKYLRKSSLDELPQLINVLRNEMSLVGPRMICPEEMALYQQAGINLLTVKPGITGLWQVSGRSEISYDDRVQMDMYYIRNWTIWSDLQLLLRTVPCVLSGRGAY